ncbi:hypothetical protein K504DRAFT_466535 [Pleomassaria siparia CBS 279.74]|uniref:Ams2/SPT21 N-terminal domain-containing protein n=1 Tax=Pleomassaria siparia CBS 279.74 TaxID=1314801 RepID=A0A6G1KBG1_9PLEO|nr:hypothetical protein K504DRAFT_466535 [Pleomassaria siparia CBS 279.74]
MSLSANSPGSHAAQVVSRAPSNDCESMSDIPRRQMRVKILYTFDDQNKSNCLARLPNALNIPTVSLDETTEVGVIDLRSCIQAIAAASPELVAKLGHDYTVYAYDYSEYETPLVGQGMLSWILASASASPNAPANQSKTMVTGRVCKNILGLFSNGIKETLEVKLKLVPVPTCKQSEYVENMERYHSLSKLMPEGLDYNAWADFLKANPAIGELAYPTAGDSSRSLQQSAFGGLDAIQDMLARPQDDSFRHGMYSEQFGMSFNTHDIRPSSPATSVASYTPAAYNSYFNHDSRPASRASFHSDTVAQPSRHPSVASEVQDQQDASLAKKRVRLTQAKRPKKSVLGANNDSLRVTASTAASVRLHRPVATNPATALASVEQVPRAPTPRPAHAAFPQSHGLRLPAPSLLRHGSMDSARPYVTPYEPGIFSDAAVESADDERGSPGETPMEMPSSPPVMSTRLSSSAPSSPGLPTLPYPADSGFVSDIGPVRDDDEIENGAKPWDGSDLPTASDARPRPKIDRSNRPWTEVNPGPVELLPKSYIPKPKQYHRPYSIPPIVDSGGKKGEGVQELREKELAITKMSEAFQGHAESLNITKADTTSLDAFKIPGEQAPTQDTTQPTTEVNFAIHGQQAPQADQWQQFNSHADSKNPAYSSFPNESVSYPSRSTTPNPPPPKRSKPSKPRGLPRSHTWSGGPMSDAAGPPDGNPRQPRSGSGAKRRQIITNKLNDALSAGEMPTFCNNCGEIETPTWRKAFTRVEHGSPDDVRLSTDGNGIVGFEVIEPAEDSEEGPKYRIFKQILEQEEKQAKTYTSLVLCNPCGLWLNKKGVMRPPEVWAKKPLAPGEKRKRTRKPAPSRKRAKGSNDDPQSDAIVPHSESVHGPRGVHNKHALQPMDDATAQAALQRAIQSSPVGFQGSQASPIDVDPDLTPRPTRRLLFPSPRKVGEAKSLDGSQTSMSPKSVAAPNSVELHVRTLSVNIEDIDKENCPPPADQGEADDLAHLFEDSPVYKTPTKGALFQDLLKTPTPVSRRRILLTPKRGADNVEMKTPSHNILVMTPNRSGRAATIAPETPFTRRLNALMSNCLPNSPSQTMDLSAFPAFNTPGRAQVQNQFYDFMNDDFLSSDFPIPSSPPGGLGFSLYEDPATSTVGLWSGVSVFNSDPIRIDDEHDDTENTTTGTSQAPVKESVLKMNGMSVDFVAMIDDDVVGNANRQGDDDANQNAGAMKDTKSVEVSVETHEQSTSVVESTESDAS